MSCCANARQQVGPEERARVVDRLFTVRAQGEPLAPAVERIAFSAVGALIGFGLLAAIRRSPIAKAKLAGY